MAAMQRDGSVSEYCNAGLCRNSP